jgi:aminopeptidase N
MAPTRWYDMATLALRAERNERLVEDWLYDLNVVWWRFMTPAQRVERAPDLEALLRDRLDTAAEPGQKSSWFAGLRNVATTPETVNWLRALWQRDITIPGLPLVETDETELAYALALRGVADEIRILDAQRDRITNPDRRARFEFVRDAAVSDVGVRERWFRALEDPQNRRRETWVLQGVGLLNHALRAGHAGTLLPKSMEMVLDVHRTGALFFDEAWIGATLKGHSSPQAAAVVARFIDTLPPDYPPRLRAKLLQGSDLLMRAARSQAP